MKKKHLYLSLLSTTILFVPVVTFATSCSCSSNPGGPVDPGDNSPRLEVKFLDGSNVLQQEKNKLVSKELSCFYIKGGQSNSVEAQYSIFKDGALYNNDDLYIENNKIVVTSQFNDFLDGKIDLQIKASYKDNNSVIESDFLNVSVYPASTKIDLVINPESGEISQNRDNDSQISVGAIVELSSDEMIQWDIKYNGQSNAPAQISVQQNDSSLIFVVAKGFDITSDIKIDVICSVVKVGQQQASYAQKTSIYVHPANLDYNLVSSANFLQQYSSEESSVVVSIDGLYPVPENPTISFALTYNNLPITTSSQPIRYVQNTQTKLTIYCEQGTSISEIKSIEVNASVNGIGKSLSIAVLPEDTFAIQASETSVQQSSSEDKNIEISPVHNITSPNTITYPTPINLPSYCTFTDNHDNTATLTIKAGNSGKVDTINIVGLVNGRNTNNIEITVIPSNVENLLSLDVSPSDSFVQPASAIDDTEAKALFTLNSSNEIINPNNAQWSYKAYFVNEPNTNVNIENYDITFSSSKNTGTIIFNPTTKLIKESLKIEVSCSLYNSLITKTITLTPHDKTINITSDTNTIIQKNYFSSLININSALVNVEPNNLKFTCTDENGNALGDEFEITNGNNNNLVITLKSIQDSKETAVKSIKVIASDISDSAIVSNEILIDVQTQETSLILTLHDDTYYSVDGIKGEFNYDSLIIPSEYNNKPVEVISENAFANLESLNKITIPDSIREIEKNAFSNTGILNNAIDNSIVLSTPNVNGHQWVLGYKGDINDDITLNETVIGIADAAFANCQSIKKINTNNVKKISNSSFYNSSITSIIVGEKTVEIGESALAWCENLENISFLSNEITINENAFYHDIKLSTINLPENVNKIGSLAFSFTNISNINIKNAVYVDSQAFENCTNLQVISANEQNQNYSSIDGVLFQKNSSNNNLVLVKYPQAKQAENDRYEIPANVNEIGQYAFTNTLITSINLGGVEKIGAHAFNGSQLRTASFLYVKIIENNAFSFSNLSNIEFGEEIISIGEGAFANCISLENVYFLGEVPPSFGGTQPFGVMLENLSIYVPSGSKTAYDAALPYYSSIIKER